MKLLDIQMEDAQKMANGQDLPNFSKAGTGKTLSTLEAFRLKGHSAGLVQGPLTSLYMWKENIEEHLGATAQILHGSKRAIKGNPDFLITTYDTASSSLSPMLKRWFNQHSGGTALINDESHYVRSVTAKRAKTTWGHHFDGVGGLCEDFDDVWNLSGNPMWGHANDLWAQLRPLYPELFAHYRSLEYEDFVGNFCVQKLRKYHPNMAPKMAIVGSTNEIMLNRLLYRDIGAIRREEAPGLPPLRERVLRVPIKGVPKEYAAFFKNKSHDQISAMLSGDSASDDDETLLHEAWKAVSLAKIPQLGDYVAEATRDCPVLLGVWHTDVGAEWVKLLEEKHKLRVGRIYGAVPLKQREAVKNKFNNGDLDVIVGQMSAMKESWNLQAASNHVIIAQSNPSPGTVEQFFKRVYRYGQNNAVQLDHALADHEVDDMLYEIMRSKEKSAERVHLN